ncbi:nucleoside/nucleotide kinase family protein [Hydrogenophaga pseudoflava]|uniref:nucleoside/nucleotide kinase family protein n=1 Tax=Hydrogenophaga pseudoflava TaxID=47421 RepID=UPI0027E4CFA3|nr:nucleoside/nucleotide kinase family protein [Hydrogenophaga pseudoflava]MDQ7745845.1 nucleoside/nucleotide kinase family protein [Hydrogenophaga pseudoflava]
MTVPRLHPDLIERLQALAAGPRRLLGVVGPPGAGKSTLAALMAQALGERAQAVPMDGYHLAQVELERLGRAGRKGAPDTFDAAGYAALLRRLRQQAPGETVYAPDFRREIEEPVAGALPVFAGTPLVITEGNYLLLDDDPAWAPVAALLDEVWYLDVPAALRLERLAARHMQFGRTREQAMSWIAQTDEPNARRIEASAHRAQRRVGWDERLGQFA